MSTFAIYKVIAINDRNINYLKLKKIFKIKKQRINKNL